MIKAQLTQAYRRWRDFTWRGPYRAWTGPSARWLAVIALILALGLTAVLVAGLMGFNQGVLDRELATQAEIENHLSRGVDYLEAGRKGLAAAEFEMVLRLDPENLQARQQLEGLLATPTPSPTPIGPRPTPPVLVGPAVAPPATLAPTVSIGGELLQQAQAALDQGDWPLALDLLEQLAVLDPEYQPEDVQALRFDVSYKFGLELLNGGHLEEALRAFDQALSIKPDDPDAKEQRDLVALYVNVLTTWGLNWPQVVRDLHSIYDQQPGYLDVSERLVTAETAWADDLSEAGDWCQASEHYQAILRLETSAELQVKERKATTYCANPSTAPTQPVEELVDSLAPAQPTAASSWSGQVGFASFSPEFQRWTVYRLPLGGQGRPLPVVDGASQPAFGPNGSRLAMRSERGDQTGLVTVNADGSNWLRVTTFAEDGRPSWSPDGRQLAFDSNREGDRRWRLYRTGSRGGEEVVLGLGRWPAWSPNGNTIAFQGCDERGNRCGLWLIGVDGSNPQPVTNIPGDTMPAWSPDGTQLAFASAERTGNWDIFVVKTKTGQVTSVASSPGIDAHPTWSPTGRQLAVLSNRDGAWAIHVTDLAGSTSSRVITIPGQIPDWFEAQISWGP